MNPQGGPHDGASIAFSFDAAKLRLGVHSNRHSQEEGRTMCDYSLLAVPNRLAAEGEALVAHRFQTGAMGLAPAAEIAALATERHATPGRGWWSVLKYCFTPRPAKVVCAVCVPPGAQLLLRDIPEQLQGECKVSGTEEVTFTQTTAIEYHYRDAVRFANGREVLLQRLKQGQRADVLRLSLKEPQSKTARIGNRHDEHSVENAAEQSATVARDY